MVILSTDSTPYLQSGDEDIGLHYRVVVRITDMMYVKCLEHSKTGVDEKVDWDLPIDPMLDHGRSVEAPH